MRWRLLTIKLQRKMNRKIKNKTTNEGLSEPSHKADVMRGSLLIIGDVHGKVDNYWKILKKHKKGRSIQVGDFGFHKQHNWHLKNIDWSQHQINFGNHDDYTFLNEPHSLSNWSYSFQEKLMTVRGAFSVDKEFRTKDIDWWENEELNYEEMSNAIGHYILNRPKIMITHDCPQSIRKEIFNISEKSMTSNGLQQMFEMHQPDIWIFGHHHKSIRKKINGTDFICLNELETVLL